MSDKEKSRRTEQPTPKRLRDIRRKGQVSKSREVVSIAMMIAVIAYFWFGWRSAWSAYEQAIIYATELIDKPFEEALPSIVDMLSTQFLYIVMPLAVLLIVVGVIANVLQVGWLFSTAPVVPMFDRVNPMNGFRKVFSVHNFFEFVKSFVKVLIIGSTGVVIFLQLIEPIVRIPYCGTGCELAVIESIAVRIAVYSIALIMVLAALDVLLQKRLFLRENRMTLEEVKREKRDMQGDPQVLGKRREAHKEIVGQAVRVSVEEATVILLDYQQRAVIIRYVPDEMSLPVMTTVSHGQLTQRIKEMAAILDCPTREDPSLVAELIRYGREGGYIPSECIEGVAIALKELL